MQITIASRFKEAASAAAIWATLSGTLEEQFGQLAAQMNTHAAKRQKVRDAMRELEPLADMGDVDAQVSYNDLVDQDTALAEYGYVLDRIQTDLARRLGEQAVMERVCSVIYPRGR